MRISKRTVIVVALGTGIAIALAAYAVTQGDYFQATGNITATTNYTELGADKLDFTSGENRIEMGAGTDYIKTGDGNDVINLESGYDTITFGATGSETEKIMFDTGDYSKIVYWGSTQTVEVKSGGDVVITIGTNQ